MASMREEIWIATREYAGIAEAGGVKNVAQSLAEGLARLGKKTVVFIPKYGCVDEFSVDLFSTEVHCAGKKHTVTFSETHSGTVAIILVAADIFLQKRAVYTYTEEDERDIPGAVRGKGHFDTDEVNAVFQLAVIAYAKETSLRPDIVHCQDGHVAMIPALAREGSSYLGDVRPLFERTGFVTTVHNAGAGYRQVISSIERARELTGLPLPVLSKGLLCGRIEPFLLAAEYGRLSTVSPWYADELVSEAGDKHTEGLSLEFARRGIKIEGITNGIDFHRYNPSNPSKSYISFPYKPWEGDIGGKLRFRKLLVENIDLLDAGTVVRTGYLKPEENSVFFAYQGRIAEQKGIRVLLGAGKRLLERVPCARFLVMGQGEREMEEELERFAIEHEGRAVFARGYDRIGARQIICAADFVVLPSAFEPCGLEDYIAQILGSIPVAHAVGGLQKIVNGKTGFLYQTEEEKAEEETLADLLVFLAQKMLKESAESGAEPKENGGGGEPRLAEIIAAAAQNVVQNCGWISIIEKSYLPLYELARLEVQKPQAMAETLP